LWEELSRFWLQVLGYLVPDFFQLAMRMAVLLDSTGKANLIITRIVSSSPRLVARPSICAEVQNRSTIDLWICVSKLDGSDLACLSCDHNSQRRA